MRANHRGVAQPGRALRLGRRCSSISNKVGTPYYDVYIYGTSSEIYSEDEAQKLAKVLRDIADTLEKLEFPVPDYDSINSFTGEDMSRNPDKKKLKDSC